MKITTSQLRQIIKEEVSSLTEAYSSERPYPKAVIQTKVVPAGKTMPARIVAIDDMTKARKEEPIKGRGSRSEAGDFETHLRLATELAQEQGYKGIMVFNGNLSDYVGQYAWYIYSMDTVTKL
jgi:hypothetical protein